jgi:hypothetical protein
MLVKIWKTHTLLLRGILPILISIYSLKWLYILSEKTCFTQNYYKHLQKELHQTVAGHSTYFPGQRQSHLIIQTSKSNMQSVQQQQNLNRISLWSVFNSDKGDIPVQLNSWNVFPVSENEWPEIIQFEPWISRKRRHQNVIGVYKKWVEKRETECMTWAAVRAVWPRKC